MTLEEQQHIKQKDYAEAMRYIANAEDDLQKAGKDNDSKHYKDAKYVRRACGTAYNAVLIALDTWLGSKGVELPKKERKSIDFYRENLRKLDKKLLQHLNIAYSTLHLSGYYDGNLSKGNVTDGFEAANLIVNRINPHPEAL